MNAGVARRAFRHGRHCGDRAAVFQVGDKVLVCIIDGLGHGEAAEEAAVAAIEYVEAHGAESLEDIFVGCDKAIRHTRGVAMGLASIDPENLLVSYASIGNTRFALVATKPRYFAGGNGIVGNGLSRVHCETANIRKGAVVVMWTDGLPSVIDFARFRQVLGNDAQHAAETILDAHASPTDDSGIVVYRHG